MGRGRGLPGAAIVVSAVLTACAPRYDTPWGEAPAAPRLTLDGGAGTLRAADGLTLPLRAWSPDDRRFPGGPWAVVLALHGFNDYSRAFAEAGRWLADHGVAVLAYDQRGFGGGPRAGAWAGTAALVGDLRAAAAVLRDRYPGVPLYLLGESMGGAVVMAALADPDPPKVDGAILSAPAVWGRSTLPWAYRLLLDTLVRVAPALRLSGSGLGVWPSDNQEMLVALASDPLVLKKTRVDAIHGLTGLMDEALAIGRAGALPGPVLWLYGARDEIIPPAQTLAAAAPLRPKDDQTFVAYPQGYHMLLRDLQGETVLRDILSWLGDHDAPLPSGLAVDPAAIRIPGPPRPGARAPGVIEAKPEP
jgi:alpha-beta hydrolase superfamily lysophospholipase